MLMAALFGLQNAHTIESKLCRWFWIGCIICATFEITRELLQLLGNIDRGILQCSPKWKCHVVRGMDFCNFVCCIAFCLPLWGTLRRTVVRMLVERPTVWYLLVAATGNQILWVYHQRLSFNVPYLFKVLLPNAPISQELACMMHVLACSIGDCELAASSPLSLG